MRPRLLAHDNNLLQASPAVRESFLSRVGFSRSAVAAIQSSLRRILAACGAEALSGIPHPRDERARGHGRQAAGSALHCPFRPPGSFDVFANSGYALEGTPTLSLLPLAGISQPLGVSVDSPGQITGFKSDIEFEPVIFKPF